MVRPRQPMVDGSMYHGRFVRAAGDGQELPGHRLL